MQCICIDFYSISILELFILVLVLKVNNSGELSQSNKDLVYCFFFRPPISHLPSSLLPFFFRMPNFLLIKLFFRLNFFFFFATLLTFSSLYACSSRYISSISGHIHCKIFCVGLIRKKLVTLHESNRPQSNVRIAINTYAIKTHIKMRKRTVFREAKDENGFCSISVSSKHC